jgi:hypothetical protein
VQVYVDTNHNLGDPDVADRLFEVRRDGTLALYQGLGNNADGLAWETEPLVSDIWTAAVGSPSTNQWVVEMEVDTVIEGIALADPYGMMLEVLYGDEAVVWPEGAIPINAATWANVDNPLCP